MQILCSNFPPVKTQNATFADTFYEFLPKADCLNIAVGYVTADSLIELQKAVELNHVHQLNLIIGMHYIDQFTPVEYRTAVKLNEFLHTNAIGEVRLVTPFRYHGKMYTFYRSGKPFASIIGSNNLSSIVDSRNGIYETSLYVSEAGILNDLDKLFHNLYDKATENIADLEITSFKEENAVLEGQDFVEKASMEEIIECQKALTSVRFEIPIKDMTDASKRTFDNVFEQIQEKWGEFRYSAPLTFDNIQARSRAMILWGISNEFSSTIPIATSDKSELYMGYATINGDMSGGFAPICDITKTKLFALARWMNKNAPIKNAIPEAVLLKPPGAELAINPKTGKPLLAEEALMPYEFLDEVIWRLENLQQTAQQMLKERFLYEKDHNITFEQKKAWLEKFAKRVQFAQLK